MAKAKRARQSQQATRSQVTPPPAIPVATLGSPAAFPIATEGAPDLPRPPMRVLATDPIPPARPAPVAVAPPPLERPKLPPAAPLVVATKLIPGLTAALRAAERTGRSNDSAVLNAVLVPLSEAIVKSQLPVDDAEVRALLDKISNL